MKELIIKKFGLMENIPYIAAKVESDYLKIHDDYGSPIHVTKNWFYDDFETLQEDGSYYQYVLWEIDLEYMSISLLHSMIMAKEKLTELFGSSDGEYINYMLSFYLTELLVGTTVEPLYYHEFYLPVMDDSSYLRYALEGDEEYVVESDEYDENDILIHSQELLDVILFHSQELLDVLNDTVIELARNHILNGKTTILNIDGVDRDVVYYNIDYDNKYAMFMDDNFEFFSVKFDKEDTPISCEKLEFDEMYYYYDTLLD